MLALVGNLWTFINVTPLFAEAKGPKIRPMSLGISLSLF